MKNHDDLVEEYLEKREEGMDFSAIRKELRLRRVSDDDIKIIVKEIDYLILYGEEEQVANRTYIEYFWIGLALFLLGAGITFGTYYDWIDLGDRYIIAYGPMLAGVSMMGARKVKRMQNSKFRRRR